MRNPLFAATLFAAAAIATPSLVQADGSAIAIDALKVQQGSAYGQYLTDGAGRPLYMFSHDKQAKSMCDYPCLSAWPSAQAIFDKPSAGDMVSADKIGLLTRPDGRLQVTYGGAPLYYFFKDKAAEDPTGQNLQAFGGQWHLVAPDGSAIDHQAS